jgi:drug/metabolite transporter (DMT)-like permease
LSFILRKRSVIVMTTAVASPVTNRTALAAAGVTMLLWASAFIVIRAIGDHYSPGALALGRMLAGSVALSAVALVVRPQLPRGRPLLLVIAYGALWFGLYAVLVNASERHLDAGTAALVVNLGPILIAVLAGLYLGEGFPRSLIAGLAIAFVGVAVIAAATSTGRHDVAGVLFALGAAALYAVGVLLQKRALGSVGAFSATWLGCLFGAVVCLPFTPGLVREAASAPASATLGVIYLGLFPTAIAFGTWAYALKRTTAGKLSSSSYLVPGIAVLLSWLALGEAPSVLALIGGVLCLAGVAVTRLGAAKK